MFQYGVGNKESCFKDGVARGGLLQCFLEAGIQSFLYMSVLCNTSQIHIMFK
uniref:Uncharacterized protein n=1 Tax=Arundo donax TaxID=35708 RepID=A0A0A8ZQ55_ARUDO